MIYLDKVNPADRPGTTLDQLAEDLVAQGAKLIIFNSDDMKDGLDRRSPRPTLTSRDHGLRRQVWTDGKDFAEICPTSATSWAGWNTAR